MLGWQEGAGSRGTLGSAKTQAWGGRSRQPVAGSRPSLLASCALTPRSVGWPRQSAAGSTSL